MENEHEEQEEQEEHEEHEEHEEPGHSQWVDRPPIHIILASQSPRRKQLLEEAGVDFVVRVPQTPVDETLDEDLLLNPREAVKKLAERKAGMVVQELLEESSVDEESLDDEHRQTGKQPLTGMYLVIGADTMVVKGNQIFGKPKNLSHAKFMLRQLSGNTHQVMTGVSVWLISAPEPDSVSIGFRTFVDVSSVSFHELSDETIDEYLRKGESFDKAGAYAVQGYGAALVSEVEGALDTVIGLPVGRLLDEFSDFFIT